jgi:hypothetical protein
MHRSRIGGSNSLETSFRRGVGGDPARQAESAFRPRAILKVTVHGRLPCCP